MSRTILEEVRAPLREGPGGGGRRRAGEEGGLRHLHARGVSGAHALRPHDEGVPGVIKWEIDCFLSC